MRTNDERIDSDLDAMRAMDTIDLLRERAALMARIPIIAAQIQDKERRPKTTEDESVEWCDYRDWRRRARLALAHHKHDLIQIKYILTERRDTGTAGNLLKSEIQSTKELSEEEKEASKLNIERAARIRAAIERTDAEGMLLRLYRAIRHLLDSHINSLPDELDADDRQALFMVGTYLRKQYGGGRVTKFCDSPPLTSRIMD